MVAGSVFLAQGLPPSQAHRTVQTFAELVQVKVEGLRGSHRLDPERAAQEGTAAFERDCRAWATTQQKLVELMRDGSRRN
jgi:DNA-binding IclR family transcriptional regulator